MIYVGTSGLSYKEWKGVFYPDKLPAKDYLSFYSQHFSTTEINNTFYRSPSEGTSAKWAEQVPENFRFTLKLNRKITHNKRLKDVEDEMEWFLKGAAALGKKLGTLLVQLPPYFREDTEVLEHFLEGCSQRLVIMHLTGRWEECSMGKCVNCGPYCAASIASLPGFSVLSDWPECEMTVRSGWRNGYPC